MPIFGAMSSRRSWGSLTSSVLRLPSALFVLGLATVGLAWPRPALSAESYWGQQIARVRLDCDAQLSLDDFASQITQKAGEPLDRAKVAESLKNLYATGRFRELRADIERTESGVELIFVARAVFFVGVIHVVGTPETLDPSVLTAASRLQLGQRIEEEDLASARKRLAQVLADNGYYRAQIESQVLPDLDTQEADIVFSIVPGRPARLSGVEFQGTLTVPPQRLVAVSGWRPGFHLTLAQLERGLLKIHRFYAMRGRPQATTSINKRIHDPKSNTERLLVQVEAGPLVRVHIKGARISSSKLRELLPFFQEGSIDEGAVVRGQQSLEDYFERQACFRTAVKAKRVSHPESQTVDIAYAVTLGEPSQFVGYAFRGNLIVQATDLAARLTIHPRDFFRERGLFSREMLARDTKALKALYESQGFPDARVTPRVNDHHEGQLGHVFVTFEIEEGLRKTVGQLALQGIGADMQKDIWRSLLSKPGQPYSPDHAQVDRESILSYLADRGYPHATVTWTASPATREQEVNLTFRIEPGRQEKIRRVVVLGNERTRAGTIERELTLRSGDPLSQTNILESQRRLYELGTFSQIQISTQDPRSPETAKTVLVSIEEARRWTVGYGGGMEVQRLAGNQPQGQYKASPRLSLEVTRLNVGGRAQTVTLRGRLSNLEKGGAISYLIPRFPTRRDLSLRLNGLVDRSREVLTFTSRRREASVSLEKRFSPTTFLAGRFSFRRVEALDLQVKEQLIPLFSRKARVAMLGVSYANDHRDDPADATDGSYSLADAGVSWKKLGSESNFVRISGQNATYHSLSPYVTFARNTRFAVESTVGHVSAGEGIPLPERFFLGGDESHRGFSINQAGPRELIEGFPIGGNALFLNSLELRARFAGNRLGFVIFHDAGNVYSRIQRMRLLKVNQSSPTEFDYTAHAVGLGISYRTPVGPLRLDVGYNLNPPRYQVVKPPEDVVEVRRLSNFQFFLSIGQSF